MKISSLRRNAGFTIVELLVAMVISLIIVGVLVNVTSSSLKTFKGGKNKVKAQYTAVLALDQLSRDLESMIYRSGEQFDWLEAKTETLDYGANDSGGGSKNLNNAKAFSTRFAFFSTVPDRYNGDYTEPGDVSCVHYGLRFSDVSGGDVPTLALYREIINPDVTFQPDKPLEDLLSLERATGSDDPVLLDKLDGTYFNTLDNAENFLCENIKELSIILVVEYQWKNGTTTVNGVQVDNIDTGIARCSLVDTGATLKSSLTAFALGGDRYWHQPQTISGFPSGAVISEIKAIEVHAQILSENSIPKLTLPQTVTLKEEIERELTYYTRTINLPQLRR